MIEQFLCFYGRGKQRFGGAVEEFLGRLSLGSSSRLCSLMSEHGSDKGNGWHNYTLLYDVLLQSYLDDEGCLFEAGIGTTDPGISCNMGSSGVPGASLRAWREYLSRFVIYGCDIDASILLESDRIRSFYVDLLDQASVTGLFKCIPHLKFKLVIDDGLHVFEANRNLFEACFKQVEPEGLYVIEDISMSVESIAKYDALATSTGCDGFFFRLPNSLNEIDNAVLVLSKA